MPTLAIRRSHPVLALALVVGTARFAHAQAPADRTDFGVFAGSTTPEGRLADYAATGFHVGALVERRLLASWLAVRAEAALHRIAQPAGPVIVPASGGGVPAASEDEDPMHVVIGALNAVVYAPVAGAVRPYAIGGIGVHRATGHSRYSVPPVGESDWKLGVSGGVGLAVPLRGVTPFVEARYHRMYATHVSTRLVPVSLGVRF